MKAIINFGGFSGKVSIQHGVATISGDSDFGVSMRELKSVVKTIDIHPTEHGFDLRFEYGGWIVYMTNDIHNPQTLIITRHKESGVGETLNEEYFTRRGEWLPMPKGYGPMPENAFRIFIFVPEPKKAEAPA